MLHDYRMYYLDGKGHIQKAAPFTCRSDEEAISIVHNYQDGRAMELWCLDRLVQVFPSAEGDMRDVRRFLPRRRDQHAHFRSSKPPARHP